MEIANIYVKLNQKLRSFVGICRRDLKSTQIRKFEELEQRKTQDFTERKKNQKRVEQFHLLCPQSSKDL